MPGLREKATFLLSVFVMYWSLPLTVAFGEWTNSYKCRNDVFAWTLFLLRFFKVRLYRAGEQECYRDGPCIWLCNHRDWGDFFIDLYVVEGRAGFLSRLAVLVAFPVFGIYGLVTRTAVFFRRNTKGRDFSKFNEYITQQIKRGPCQGIVVYPEGTRNVKAESLPLRRGMLRYAYAERTPVQVVITTNKEQVLSQKLGKASFGARCVVSYGGLIKPSDHADFEAFFEAVKDAWEAQWETAYGTRVADAKEVLPSEMKLFVPHYSVTYGSYVRMLAYSYFTVLLMIAVAALTFVSAQRVLGLQVVHFGGFGTDWVVLSLFLLVFVACTKLITRKQD